MRLSITVKRQNNFKNVFFSFDISQPLYVCDIGYHKTPARHSYGPAIRPYYLLHLIESGSGVIERNGEITRLSAGECFLIRPNEITTYRADEQTPWTYYWIAFNGVFAKTLTEQVFSSLCPAYKRSALLTLKTAVERIEGDTVSCLNLLFGVLDGIARTEKTQETDVVATTLSYLEHNYFKNVSVSNLAQQYGYSRAHFTAMFSAKTGISPYRYLTNIRIEKAKELLLQGTYSVSEIAYSVGFSSVIRFSNTFKTYTGLSPTAYQKQSR